MATQIKTEVSGAEEIKKTEIQRVKKFLVFFKIKWWETVNQEHIGNDIYIETSKEIRNVFVNRNKIN